MANYEQMRPKREDIYYQFYDMKSVQSNTELTGLTPSLPLSDDVAASFSDIYGMPIPDNLPNDENGEEEEV